MKTLTLSIILLLLALSTVSASNCKNSSNNKKGKKNESGKRKCQKYESSSSTDDSRTFSTSDVERLGLGRVIYRAEEPGVPGIYFPDNPFVDIRNDPASYYESLPNNPFNRPPPSNNNTITTNANNNVNKPPCNKPPTSVASVGNNNANKPSIVRPPKPSKPAVPNYGGKPYTPVPSTLSPPPTNYGSRPSTQGVQSLNATRPAPCPSTSVASVGSIGSIGSVGSVASVGNNNQSINSGVVNHSSLSAPPLHNINNNNSNGNSIVAHNGGCCHHEEPDLPDMSSLYLEKQQQHHHSMPLLPRQYSPQLTRTPMYDPAWTVQPGSWPGYNTWYVPPNPFHHQAPPPMYMPGPNGAQILLNDDYHISVGANSAKFRGRKQLNVHDSDVCAGFGGLYLITKDIPMGYEADACGMANGRPADVYEQNIRDVIRTIGHCLSGLVETVRVRQYFGHRVQGMVMSVDKRYGPGIQHHKDYSVEAQPVLCRINGQKKKTKKRKEKGRKRRKNRKVSSDSDSSSSAASSSSCNSDYS